MNNHEHEYQPTIRGESRCVWCGESKPAWEQKEDGDVP